MIKSNVRNIVKLMYAFSLQSKGKKSYINIGKMIKKQEQASTITSKFPSGQVFGKKITNNKFQQKEREQSLQDEKWFQGGNSNNTNMSSEQQQMNYKIKTAIRCETLFYQCERKKHKLELRHYALMFGKVLELRRANPSQKKDNDGYSKFLQTVFKKIDDMAPEELVRILYAIKCQNVNIQEMKLILPIVEKIINQFSNLSNNQLQPKSYETLTLATTVKLFHSLHFILERTGSHYEKKLKVLMNETLNYILFRSMKTKKYSKSGQYFPLRLKLSFLSACKLIQASNACIKNLILSILVEKERLTLETLLELQKTLFQSKELLQKTRKQLFTQKQVHLKYNILFRIEKYINNLIPNDLKKSSNYEILNKKLVNHLTFISQLTFDELNLLEMTSHKDEQIFKILSLYHQGYKNALIENYSSLNEKQDIVSFYNRNQNSQHSLFELLNYFYNRLKVDGGNNMRPSLRKQIKEFINLLCKFYGKLNFLTQSVIIEILIVSNFTNLKPILTEYLEINTFRTASNKVNKPHFFNKDKQLMMDNFLHMFNYHEVFRLNCPSQYEVFINTNIKVILKYIFKSSQTINLEKYSFQIAQYCKDLPQENLTGFIQEIINLYLRLSSLNRSFKKNDVDVIYKNKEHFLSTENNNEIQLQNQTDIFGQDVALKELRQSLQSERLLPTLQNDQQIMREFYNIQQRIRNKLRMALKNFKFLLLLFENIRHQNGKQNYSKIIDQNLYSKLLLNFKSQIECLKFERLLTKENCSDLTEIHELLKSEWRNSLSQIQVRNQMLMHDILTNKVKISHQTIQKAQQTQSIQSKSQQTHPIPDKTLQQNQQQQVEEEQSQDMEYTEQIEYLQGKDFLELQTFKNYLQKVQKNSFYFYNKNKQTLQQINQITKQFTQIPKQIQKNQKNTSILTQLMTHYSLGSQNTQQSQKIIDLAGIDDLKISKENFHQIFALQIQSLDNKAIYNMRVFKKSYPTLNHFCLMEQNKDKRQKSNDILQKIYYVNLSKVKKNLKRRKAQDIQTHNESQKEQLNQNQQSKNRDDEVRK